MTDATKVQVVQPVREPKGAEKPRPLYLDSQAGARGVRWDTLPFYRTLNTLTSIAASTLFVYFFTIG